MKKTFRANTYFLFILLIQIFLPISYIFKGLGIKDVRLMLLTNHIIIFIVPAIIYLLITKQSPVRVLKLKKLHLKDSFLLILVAFMCQPIMMFFSLIAQFFFSNEIGDFISGIVSTPYPILLLLIGLLPAITEEITIRGIVLSGYEDKSALIACITTGLLFGIMHLDPQQFLYAAVLGFVLAYVVRITGSIFASALVHFFINGTSVTIQKIYSLIQNNLQMVTEASEVKIRNISIFEKITLIGIYGSLAVLFTMIVYLLLKKIKEWNIERGSVTIEDVELKWTSRKFRGAVKDRVFNIPFIAIIGVYIVTMIKHIIR